MGVSVPLGENYRIKSWEGVAAFQQHQDGHRQTYLGQGCLLTRTGVTCRRHGKGMSWSSTQTLERWIVHKTKQIVPNLRQRCDTKGSLGKEQQVALTPRPPRRSSYLRKAHMSVFWTYSRECGRTVLHRDGHKLVIKPSVRRFGEDGP